jgi:hypothetical protein
MRIVTISVEHNYFLNTVTKMYSKEEPDLNATYMLRYRANQHLTLWQGSVVRIVHKRHFKIPFPKLDHYSSRTEETFSKYTAMCRYNYNCCTLYVVLHDAHRCDWTFHSTRNVKAQITATRP